MKIGFFSAVNNIQSSVKSHKNISFGELDGDFYDYTPRITKSQYDARKEQINEKYDLKRSSYLSDADDLGFNNSVVWEQLKHLEQMRERELRNLESDYNY